MLDQIPPLFHVDRKGALSVGQSLGLRPWGTMSGDMRIPDSRVQEHVEWMFPDGLSTHGMNYFFWQNTPVVPPTPGFYDPKQSSDIRSHGIELIWEYVRRAAFPQLPSRYQSTFCWSSIGEAEQFAGEIGAAAAPIWRVRGQVTFRADMNGLAALTAATASRQAHLYWSGKAGTDKPARWEHFVAPGSVVEERAN